MNPNSQARIAGLVAVRPALRNDLLERAHAGELPGLARVGLTPAHLEAVLDGRTGDLDGLPVLNTPSEFEGIDHGHLAEAIIRDFDRPTILVKNGSWDPSENPAMNDQLEKARAKLEKALLRVGRVEFRNAPMLWGGTGWVVDEHLIITNRHVAELVAEADGRGTFRFKVSPAGVSSEARLDFKSEHGDDEGDTTEEVSLSAIRYLASANQPDIALFEVARSVKLPAPVSLAANKLTKDRAVAVIGYPAFDSRNDHGAVDRYFGDIFDVKRLAPGVVTQAPDASDVYFMHDATTLGGNSGSLVVDLASGKAVGLHFAGQFHTGNYAHTASQVKKALRGLRVLVTVPPKLASLRERKDGLHPSSHFRDRSGYSSTFLGTGKLKVPLPSLGDHEADVAMATEPGGKTRRELRYTHFSVKFSTSRRVPRMTACNIDGGKWRKVKRTDDQWFSDGRIPDGIQLGEADYAHPDIDRGHMVRREDPNWGTPAVVATANEDTFHYTNAAPQHARLNERMDQWLGLETYVLESAKTNGLKINVFAGPILRDSDRILETGLQVPDEFWKIVVAINEKPRGLRATGYVLSQGAFIEDITESFTYGQYRTYQVPILQIAKKTGYTFDQLVAIDALSVSGLEAAVPGAPVVLALDRLEQMVL
jgi:endonuclease G